MARGGEESFVAQVLAAMGAGDAREENARAMAVGAVLDGPGWAVGERREVALRHALFRGMMERVVEVLGEEIPSVLLKGEALGRVLFGEGSRRSSTDIDLLVLPGDYEEVRRRLLGIGFEPVREEGPRKWAYNQEALRHGRLGVVVEIHWQLAFPALPAVSPGEIFGRRRSFLLDEGLEVFVLPGDWMGIHLALHFHQHTGFAKGLLDMAAWCDRVAPGLDENAFLTKAGELGLLGVVQWPLHTLALLAGRRPPMWTGEIDRTVEIWARISAWALQGCLSREWTGGVRDSLAALNPTVPSAVGVPIRALAMLTVDGGPGEKARAVGRPILKGPHFVGRFAKRWGLFR